MTTQDMLDERYGRRRSPLRRWVSGVAIGIVAVAVGLYGWFTYSNALDDVSSQATGFHIADARSVTVDFQVTIPQGRAAACVLEAQDEEHGVVGWRVVRFEASDQGTRAFTETIPTVALATTGLVNSCWVT